MKNKSSNGWKFFALLFGALLAGVVGLYIYKQQNPDYDPWEEPWENSSSPVDLGIAEKSEAQSDSDETTDESAEEATDGEESEADNAAEESTDEK
ncbi:hypothetical protein [Bifidobacterium sp.]|jgi:hypothetical protein|uniref:hypothetical protein n=1 Tax=Bifidobacterium sp. TaxID=41200 RepID=UPI0025C10C09|nr:hypothetical protein [Bifidobacterium sp.]MCI1634875.1 hypothetical protein [Bifidobacterium sp.]